MTREALGGTAFVADTRNLASLKRGAREDEAGALREAARQFESLFTRMMLQSMREASFGDSLAGSEATDFYRDLHDAQLAMELSKGRGLGLADLLITQLSQAGLVGGQSAATAPGATGSGVSGVAAPASPASGPSRRADPAVPAGNWPPASREEFISQLRPHAERAGAALGVSADTLIAHAALETGWGRKVPRTGTGDCSFNLFGIKAGRQWQGETVSVGTIEFEAGVAERKVERFRAYRSPAECFEDYAALLASKARYEAALGTGDDAAAFAAALREGGYATDPHYDRKLAAVADSLKSLLKKAAVTPLTASTGES